MALDFAMSVYLPVYRVFARPVTIMPLVSQPGQSSYAARGIFDTRQVFVETLDGAIFSDTKTELDVLEPEFGVLPQQDDVVVIPDHEGVCGGRFVVSDRAREGNAGGEMTLRLRRLQEPRGRPKLGAASSSAPPTSRAAPNTQTGG